MIKDENKLPKVARNIKNFCRKTVEVGVFGSDNSELPMVFHVNEFGSQIKVTKKMRGYLGALGLHLKKDTKEIKIPERSTIRVAFNNKKNIDTVFKIVGTVYDSSGDITTALDAMGIKMAAFIKNNISSNVQPANHPFTTEMKGGKNKTLINTGRLLNAVRHEII